ncbi:hypothetical protein Q8W38_22215 [Vibrio splendidus]|uniref:Uncharacterized protein n=1 Tax=Vibrio splendidus TaxID=29497 RepID=A0ABD5AFS6_VIBSP|nr:hypothetical protein [Vibrio splendidus]MDH5895466.1 hypothetical protein [Vibrio splendidus]MDP2492073.1 hypothetical protein [Vibrio splendidus]
MIDKINNECAELMKDKRESLVSIWDAYFPGEGNQGTGNKVAASKSLLV